MGKVPLLVPYHILHRLNQPIEVAHAIEKVALDVVIACFCTRGDADAEVAILADEAACPLSPDRHVGSIEISQDSPLVIKLSTKVYPCLLMSLFSLGEDDKLPHHKNPLVAVRDNLGCWRVDELSVFAT
jgi:hypothetical protein